MNVYKFDEFKQWIETGREIEFSFGDTRYSVTYYGDNRKKYISFTAFYEEPVDFSSPEEFMAKAMIDGKRLQDVWPQVSEVDVF